MADHESLFFLIDLSVQQDTLRQQLMERLLTRLQSALNQQPLNLDYLEFLTRHDLVLFGSFSEQIGGVSEITEALQNLHHVVQREINASSMPIVEQETEDLQDPGIDWESAMLQEDSHSTVVVPEIVCPVDDEVLKELQRAVDPMEHSQSHGRDLYTQFLHCVSSQQ
ncbi:hypothetical protein ABVT39_002552 [Epinephelus coioides]